MRHKVPVLLPKIVSYLSLGHEEERLFSNNKVRYADWNAGTARAKYHTSCNTNIFK